MRTVPIDEARDAVIENSEVMIEPHIELSREISGLLLDLKEDYPLAFSKYISTIMHIRETKPADLDFILSVLAGRMAPLEDKFNSVGESTLRTRQAAQQDLVRKIERVGETNSQLGALLEDLRSNKK